MLDRPSLSIVRRPRPSASEYGSPITARLTTCGRVATGAPRGGGRKRPQIRQFWYTTSTSAYRMVTPVTLRAGSHGSPSWHRRGGRRAVLAYWLARTSAQRQLAEQRATVSAELAIARRDNEWLKAQIDREREAVGTMRDAFQSLAVDALNSNRSAFLDPREGIVRRFSEAGRAAVRFAPEGDRRPRCSRSPRR